MSYQKTFWEWGDLVTAEKLNNIERGIANVDQRQDLSVNVEDKVLIINVKEDE